MPPTAPPRIGLMFRPPPLMLTIGPIGLTFNPPPDTPPPAIGSFGAERSQRFRYYLHQRLRHARKLAASSAPGLPMFST